MNKVINVMLDLETLDNKVGAVITQIGAAEFDVRTGVLGKIFGMNIDAASCQKRGMTIGADTVMWWLQQSPEAQKSLLDPCPIDVVTVLTTFRNWLADLLMPDSIAPRGTEPPRLLFWCHASFDLPILTRAFELCEIPVIWGYRDYMDLRTITRLSGIRLSDFKDEKDLAHNAVSDCMAQIRYSVAAYNKVKPQLMDPDISP